jgi:hypothetical protein
MPSLELSHVIVFRPILAPSSLSVSPFRISMEISASQDSFDSRQQVFSNTPVVSWFQVPDAIERGEPMVPV